MLKLEYSIKNLIILFVMLNLTVLCYFSQSFTCDKSKNICFTSMAGAKISKDIAIDTLKSATVRKETMYTPSRYGLDTHEHAFMPYAIGKNGRNFDFYQSPSLSESQANDDLHVFANYMRSDQNYIKLNNKKTRLLMIIFILNMLFASLLYERHRNSGNTTLLDLID